MCSCGRCAGIVAIRSAIATLRKCWRNAAFRSTIRRSIAGRSEEHTSELQSLMRISYAVFCLKKKKDHNIREVRDDTKHTLYHDKLTMSLHEPGASYSKV